MDNPTPSIPGKHYHLYCISGLAADFAIFSKLKIEGVTLHPISWQIPEATDSLQQYAQKLSQQITQPNAVLLGVSFGGMLATEITKMVPVHKTIIVSSCKHRKELPLFLRIAGKLNLHKLLPYRIATQSKKLNHFIFDTRSSAEELYLKRVMLQQTDLRLMKRSLNMILNWRMSPPPAGIIHIHGTRDHLLTPGSITPTHWVQGGGHFMIWNMADEISQLIQLELNT